MITLRAPATRWAATLSRVRNLPVDSMTTSTPSSSHGSAAGSASPKTETSLPSRWIASPRALDGARKAAVDAVARQYVGERVYADQVVDRVPLRSRHPIRHVTYELEEVGRPTIADVLAPIAVREPVLIER